MSAVVSNGICAGSQRHRSFSGGSVSCLGLEFFGMRDLRSSKRVTLARPSFFFPPGLDALFLSGELGTYTSRRLAAIATTIGSEHDAQHPEHADSSQHADENHEPAHLSAPADQPGPNEIVHQGDDHAQTISRKIPRPTCPAAIKLIEIGHPDQTRSQRRERAKRSPSSRPRKSGAWTPAIPNAIPPSTP